MAKRPGCRNCIHGIIVRFDHRFPSVICQLSTEGGWDAVREFSDLCELHRMKRFKGQDSGCGHCAHEIAAEVFGHCDRGAAADYPYTHCAEVAIHTSTKPDLYSELGLDPDASDEEIQEAFRKKALETHPDAGGDREDFEAMILARDVLIDPDRRKKYDETGSTIPEDEISGILATYFSQVVKDHLGTDYNTVDLIGEMNDKLVAEIAAGRKAIEIANETARRLDDVARRVSGPELLADVARTHAEKQRKNAARMADEIETARRVIVALEEYSYTVDGLAEMLTSAAGGFVTVRFTNQ